MSRVISALACLTAAAHHDGAPSHTARDGWLAAAHDARREWDQLCDERDRLRAEVERLTSDRVRDIKDTESEITRRGWRIAELEAEVADLHERKDDLLEKRDALYERVAELEAELGLVNMSLVDPGPRDQRIAELEQALRDARACAEDDEDKGLALFLVKERIGAALAGPAKEPT